MSYKLIEVFKNTSGQETQAIYSYDDITSLLAAMNNDFGVQLKNEEVISGYCVGVNNEDGSMVDSCIYQTSEESSEKFVRPRVYTHNDYAEDNITPYDTERVATANYHTKLAAAMNKSTCMHAITILIDGTGLFMKASNWIRPTEE